MNQKDEKELNKLFRLTVVSGISVGAFSVTTITSLLALRNGVSPETTSIYALLSAAGLSASSIAFGEALKKKARLINREKNKQK